jgi:hypothetical protein
MKQLEKLFTENNVVFSLVKRSEKACLYRRDTLEGQFVSYDVFAIKTKDGQEVYPNTTAIGRWAWSPIAENRAETYFEGITAGDVVIPDIDPVTGEAISVENDMTLEELMAETEILETSIPTETLVSTPISLVELVEPSVETVDPTAPIQTKSIVDESVISNVTNIEVIQPTVEKTNDGGVVVTVAKVTKTKIQVAMVIPSGEFTQAQFAVANGLPERGIVWSKLDGLVQSGKLTKELKQLNQRGRATAVYSEVV